MPQSTRETILRCWPLVLVFGGGLLALATLQYWDVLITGKPTRDISLIIGATELAAYVWIRMFARVPVATQVRIGVVVVAAQAVVYFAVRIDGFTGAGRPMIAWRWATTAEQQFAASRCSFAAPPKLTATQVKLNTESATDYPGYRGRDRSGIVSGVHLNTDWETDPPQELWRQPIGQGWSSFAVVGPYCVTQEQRAEYEVVVCYEIRTGHEVWIHRDEARFDEITGGIGPRATPTIKHGRVFALGATGILNCLNATTGQKVWSVNILKTSNVTNRLFGMAGSPLVINGLVVVSPGGQGNSLVAYDQKTGVRVWAGGNADASYSSPQFAPLGSGNQILNFNAAGIFSHDAASGRVLWSYPWVSNPAEKNNVCQPVPFPSRSTGQNDRVLVSSGYDMGSALFEITKTDRQFKVEVFWTNRNLKSKFSSLVVRNGFVYGFDNGILTCIELETGLRKWKRGRYGHGQLILVDDVLLIQAEEGEVVLVDASPHAHRELARFQALDHRTWNHPVLSGNLLLVRNDREAACYELTVDPK